MSREVPNFCRFCGRELRIIKDRQMQSLWKECPRFSRIAEPHDSYKVSDGPDLEVFDPWTGERKR